MVNNWNNNISGWWFGTWMDYDFPIRLGMSPSQLTLTPSFFRGVGGSTTTQGLGNLRKLAGDNWVVWVANWRYERELQLPSGGIQQVVFVFEFLQQIQGNGKGQAMYFATWLRWTPKGCGTVGNLEMCGKYVNIIHIIYTKPSRKHFSIFLDVTVRRFRGLDEYRLCTSYSLDGWLNLRCDILGYPWASSCLKTSRFEGLSDNCV
jgi:hypothetical protein